MPIVSTTRFPASDYFVADPLSFKPVVKFLLQVDGVHSVHYGIQIEDGRTGYLITVWKTFEHHERAMNQPAFPEFSQSLKPFLASSPDVQHVEFDADSTPAFESPTTEFVFLKPKTDTSEENFLSALKELCKELIKGKTCHAAVWGRSKEHSSTFVLAIGWDSVQAHTDAVKEGKLPQIISTLHALADLNVKHTKLEKPSN